jgi:hypothetical protein
MGPGRFRDRRHGDRDKQRQQVRSPPARGTDRAEAWARAVFAEFDEDWQRIYLPAAITRTPDASSTVWSSTASTSILLAAPTPARSSPVFRAAAACVARIDWSGPRSARRTSPCRSRRLRGRSAVLAGRGEWAGFRLPHLRASARSDCGPASPKYRTSDSSLKSTMATHEYGLRSHRPHRCRHPPDAEEGHADPNSSQNTRTIISRRFTLLPERRAARGKLSRKVNQNQHWFWSTFRGRF